MRAPALAPALALALLLVAGAGRAGALEGLEGTVLLESDTAWRLRSPRTIQKSQNRVEVDLTWTASDALRVRGIARALYDPVHELVARDPDFDQEPIDRWQPGNGAFELELRELYLDWTARAGPARVDLRLGKQQVVWGQSFGLRVLDMVNAVDLREFILDDYEDARIPVIGLRADVAVGRWSLQALAFPDFEEDRLPDPESEFALSPQLEGLLPAAAGPQVLLERPDVPDDWEHWHFGLRAATVVRDVDVALHYWDRIDPRGTFERRIEILPDGSPLSVFRRDFVRVRTLGFSFSAAFGDFTLWGEGGLGHGRRFAVDDLADRDGVVERSDLEYAIGLDWNGWEHLFANLQLIQYVIFDHDDRIELDETREFLSLLLRFDFLGETLFPQLFVLYGTNENDTLIRPSLEWRATDRLSLTGGVDLFTGPREGLLGQYARSQRCVPAPQGGGCLLDAPSGRTNRVYLRLRYEFGLPL